VTHAQWIATRTPTPSPRLVERVVEVLETKPALARAERAEALVAVAEILLGSVLTERAGGARDAALDLLAADACVTWAFEAAADDPGTLGARAEDAMRRMAAVAR
jgi:hypothetical protein